jgi:hypothetical protein
VATLEGTAALGRIALNRMAASLAKLSVLILDNIFFSWKANYCHLNEVPSFFQMVLSIPGTEVAAFNQK